MTIEEAKKFVCGIEKVDPHAQLFAGDLDEFAGDAVDDTNGRRIVVWLNYTANNCRSEMPLARFKTYDEADAFMAVLR